MPHILELNNLYTTIYPILPESVNNALNMTLAYKIEGAWFAPSFQKGHWDGWIRLYNKKKQIFSTGIISRALSCLDQYGIEYTVLDKRVKPSFNSINQFNLVLRDYQKETVGKMLDCDRGIVKIATGGGKSVIIADFIAKTNVPTLVIVPKRVLLKQLHDNFEKWLGVEVGIIGDGVCQPKNITVATMQSLYMAYNIVYYCPMHPNEKYFSNKDKCQFCGGKVQEYIAEESEQKKEVIKSVLENVQSLIVDETQHLNSMSLQFLERKARSAYFRFGFSATPFFSQETSILVEKFTGKVIMDIPASELIKRGYLAKPIILLDKFKHTSQIVTKKYANLYKAQVVENIDRNMRIVEHVKNFTDRGKSVLVSVNYIAHGQALEDLLKPILGDRVKFINGSTGSEGMSDSLDQLNCKGLLCIIATTVFSEGVDVPSLDCLIMAKAQVSEVDTLQLAGRVLRKTDTKSIVKIIDIFDRNCKYLTSHSSARLEVYQSEPEFEIVDFNSSYYNS